MFPYKELLDSLNRDLADHTVHPFLSSDMSDQEVDAYMIRQGLLKKLCPNDEVDAALIAPATDKFLKNNDAISTNSFVYPVESEQDEIFWDYFRDFYDKATQTIACDLDYIWDNMRAGPGAAIKADSTSFYTKLFDSPLSHTSDHTLALYRAAVSRSDVWADAEMHRFKKFGTVTVPGNRLFFVAKTATNVASGESGKLRTCCTEPTVEMLFQQALGRFYADCLERSFGINLSTQQAINKELACVGSRNGTLCTIDLSDASDSISWALIQKITRGALLGYLRTFRSKATVLPDGRIVQLNMVSTMGNGFTFPLMTLLFASAVRAVYTMMGLPSSGPGSEFAVNGDDIIVRSNTYQFLVRQLRKLGFRVNDEKSFSSGHFRESCGGDYYRGRNCRSVYIKSIESLPEAYSALNRLNRWSARTGISLRETCRTIMREYKIQHLVPPSSSDDAGLKVPFKYTTPKLASNYWFLYRELIARPSRKRVPWGPQEAKNLGYRDYNPNGWAVCFLGGFAENSVVPEGLSGASRSEGADWIGVRPVRPLYRSRRSSIPFWDWLGYEPDESLASYGSWQRAVAANCDL